MESYPEIPDALFHSISNMMTTRLESNNYWYWARRMTINFNAYGVSGYIDGSIKPPADESSPSFTIWRRRDASIQVVINATLSPSASLPYALGSASARDLWLDLERRYTSISNFYIAKLRSDLQTLAKGSDSVAVYVKRIKELRSELAGLGVHMEDAEMITHALRGLPEEYEAFQNSVAVAAGIEPLRWIDFCVLLLAARAQ